MLHRVRGTQAGETQVFHSDPVADDPVDLVNVRLVLAEVDRDPDLERRRPILEHRAPGRLLPDASLVSLAWAAHTNQLFHVAPPWVLGPIAADDRAQVNQLNFGPIITSFPGPQGPAGGVKNPARFSPPIPGKIAQVFGGV